MAEFFHCACGDVFRRLDPKSEIGIEFARYSGNGLLVPDELTIRLWRASIQSMVAFRQFRPADQYLLLDGIPRTFEQAKLLADDLDVRALIYLYCNDVEQIVARLSHRASLEKRTDDVDIEIVRHRIDVYEEQTEPLLNLYPLNKVYRVNATRDRETVTKEILRALDAVRLDW